MDLQKELTNLLYKIFDGSNYIKPKYYNITEPLLIFINTKMDDQYIKGYKDGVEFCKKELTEKFTKAGYKI